MSGPRVELVDPHDATGVAAWHAASYAGASVGRTRPLVTTLEALTASATDPHPKRSRELWAAVEDGVVVGALLLELSREDNTHLAEAEVDVPPEHRGRGVGAALAAVAERRCAEEGRTTLLAEVAVPSGVAVEESPGHRFAVARGLTSVHVEDRLLLDLPVDPTGLAAAASPRHAAYDVIGWEGECPDEHLDVYAALGTAMNHDVPSGGVDRTPTTVTVADVRRSDLRLAAQGWDQHVAAARERETGALVGYSVLMLDRHDPLLGYQDDTLVLREHRGHALGTALKAANLVRFQAAHPDVTAVTTWTAVDNPPMQRVNHAFGFRPVEQMHEMQRTS